MCFVPQGVQKGECCKIFTLLLHDALTFFLFFKWFGAHLLGDSLTFLDCTLSLFAMLHFGVSHALRYFLTLHFFATLSLVGIAIEYLLFRFMLCEYNKNQ